MFVQCKRLLPDSSFSYTVFSYRMLVTERSHYKFSRVTKRSMYATYVRNDNVNALKSLASSKYQTNVPSMTFWFTPSRRCPWQALSCMVYIWCTPDKIVVQVTDISNMPQVACWENGFQKALWPWFWSNSKALFWWHSSLDATLEPFTLA